MLDIDKYAYCSRLGSVHPAEKFCFAVLTLMICLAANSILVSFIVLAIMADLAIYRGGIPWFVYLRLLLVPTGFLIIGILTIAINEVPASAAILWGIDIWGRRIGMTLPSLTAGARMFLKALGSVSCLYFLALTTPMVELISVLKRLKISPLFLELLSLTYRFIFVLLDTANQISRSQVSRLGYSNFRNSYRSLGNLTSGLLIRSLIRSRDLYTALEARGYEGELKVMEADYQVSGGNIILISSWIVSLIILVVVTGGRV